MKTIDISAREWFDEVNGNSYFSAKIILDYSTKKEKTLEMPFQYGSGEHYIDMANQLLIEEGIIERKRHDSGSYLPLWQYCRDNNIILRTNKQENCKKRDL
jgi:hypothetical protein